MLVFRTEPMQKVRIVSLDADKANVVAALHTMGAIDLRKSQLQLEDDKPPEYSTDVSDSLIRVTGVLQLLPERNIRVERQGKLQQVIAEVKGMKSIGEAYDLGAERKLVEDDIRAAAYAEHIAAAFSGTGIDFGMLKSDRIDYKAYETDGRTARSMERAAEGMDNAEVVIRRSGRKEFIVLAACAKGAAADLIAKGSRLNELDLGAKYLDGTPGEVLKASRKRQADGRKRLADIARRLDEISRKSYSRLASIREMLEIEMMRSEASSSFKRTETAFVVEGWVQKRQVGEVRKRLAYVTRDRFQLEEIEADELAPTHTRRPKFLQPFDYLVSFYSVQRSDEIDPTWIFILSFPIFYGLMVTDVGYGIASLILATLIIRRTDPEGLMYNAARIWQLNSFAAMFFGFLSDQYFGFQLGYSTPFSFNWLKNTPELIAITVMFGVAQVVLGLAIGVINNYHHGHRKMAVAKLTSMLVVAFGTVAVAGAFFGAFSGTVTEISGIIAIASLLLTGALSGMEATEITNLITHPLSYARIMGFALGSVIIAFLIDTAFTPHLGSGAVGVLVFLLYAVIFIALHFLNMVLSIFEGIVQGVRLNFVEFFSKFYIGNGIRFKPFGYKRVYTRE